ncbi:helix-turn-helix domain-containing protein [Brevirhabdus sp.]|uniref:helix-turn-helix domain-containing protein n=1 Tax=Brevirhabdus sp. TaxID=2004514 RepID=UPI004057DBB6
MIGRSKTPASDRKDSIKGFDDFDLRLGDVLRGERATLGKSLLDVQRELKIKANYIAAIEAADVSVFETPGFIAGYVRSYARYLGMDPDWAFNRFCAEANFTNVHGMSSAANAARPAASSVRSPKAAKKRERDDDPLMNPRAPFSPMGNASSGRIDPGAIASLLVLVALIGGLGFGGWKILQQVQRVSLVPVEQSPGVVADLDPLAGAAIAADATEQGAGTVPSQRAEALDRLYRPKALDVPVLSARDGPIADINPDSVGTLAPQSPGAAGNVASAGSDPREAFNRVAQADAGGSGSGSGSGAGAMSGTDAAVAAALASGGDPQVVAADVPDVVMFAVRPAWVRVTGAGGTVLFEKILDAGERFTLPKTEEPPLLRAGNSGSVYFAVNGQTYGPAGPGTSVAKKVKLGVEALKDKYQVADLDKDPDLRKVIAVAQADATVVPTE